MVLEQAGYLSSNASLGLLLHNCRARENYPLSQGNAVAVDPMGLFGSEPPEEVAHIQADIQAALCCREHGLFPGGSLASCFPPTCIREYPPPRNNSQHNSLTLHYNSLHQPPLLTRSHRCALQHACHSPGPAQGTSIEPNQPV